MQANDAHSRPSSPWHSSAPISAASGEIGLSDPKTGEAMPVESDRRQGHVRARQLTPSSPSCTTAVKRSRRRSSTTVEAGIRRGWSARFRRRPPIAQQNELLRRRAIGLEQASALRVAVPREHVARVPTPLNAMLATRRCCCRSGRPGRTARVKRQLGRIESNGRHLLTIINEISTSRASKRQDAAAALDLRDSRSRAR